MLGVFDRRVRFSPYTVSACSGMIQERLYPVVDSLLEPGCTYEYVEYGDLSALTVSCYWTYHVESRVGVVTPHFGRQM